MALGQFYDEITYKSYSEADTLEIEANVMEKLEEVQTKILSSNVMVHFAGDPAQLAEGNWNDQDFNFLANQGEKVKFEV